MEAETGAAGLFAATTQRIDPAGLLNPGCLFPAAAPETDAREATR